MSERLPNRQGAVKSDSPGPSRTPAGDAFSELIVQIFQLDGLLTAAGDALAKPAGQTSARWRVLAAVEEGPLTVSQIARAWGLARQSVQRVADALVREGWAAYEENPGHRRAQLLRLTPRGRRALRRIQAAQRSWANGLGAEIGEAELRNSPPYLIVVVVRATHPGSGVSVALERRRSDGRRGYPPSAERVRLARAHVHRPQAVGEVLPAGRRRVRKSFGRGA